MLMELVKSEEDRKLLEIGSEVYFGFKKTEIWDEEYKYKVIGELNEELSPENVTTANVVDIVALLQKKNPSTGSFVHWNNLDDLKRYAIERPQEVADLIRSLFDDTKTIADRIKFFRERAKEFKRDISLGTALFAYLMAAFDCNEYTIYKDSSFQEFTKWFEIDAPSDIEDKYETYINVCRLLRDYLTDYSGKKATMLDSQDFIYSLTEYSEAKFQVFTKYLHYLSRQFSEYEKQPILLIEKLKLMDRGFLENIAISYSKKDKINKIRHEFIEIILNNPSNATIELLHEIEDEVNNNHETDIMRSWDDYKILCQIYYNSQRKRIKNFLKSIHSMLRSRIEESFNLKMKKDKYIQSFTGSQNFPQAHIWLSLFPESKNSHRVAGQLGFGIFPDYFVFGLHIGHEVETKDKYKHNEESVNPEQADITLKMILDKYSEVMADFKVVNEIDDETKYWKLAPGEGAWNWENCRDNGFIAIGWEEFGDLTDVSKEDFDAKNKELASQVEDWRVEGAQQAWKFANEISVGDKVVANRGTSKILGFGTVIGDYYYDEDEPRHKHKLPVEWFDTRHRTIDEGGWRKTLIELDKDKYEAFLELPTVDDDDDLAPTKTWSDIEKSLRRDFKKKLDLADCKLHFPKEMREDLERRIHTALENGKHIMLIGPPGTGKSKLAKLVCEFYKASEGDFQMSTATSDWSTFETIGGYRPKDGGSLEFRPGVFLKCFRDEKNHEPVNKWLIIDEINRADIDKAFGSLFSALTGDNVTLPYERGDNAIQVIGDTKNIENKPLEDHYFVIHPDWRILATMNTYDKSSLYEMSYAFMRRFAFVPVEIPKTIDSELIKSYIEKWEPEYDDKAVIQNLAEIWEIINKTRQIGPAIVEDIFNFVKSSEDKDYISAIIMFVLPQFEGLMDDKIVEFFKSIKERPGLNIDKLKHFMADFFQIDEKRFQSTDK